MQIVEPRAAAPEPRVAVTLAQALLKSDKMDRVIRDAVMLGVAAVQPFVSRRTDVPMKAVAQGGRQERWDRTVISSVKQCGRAVVPPVHETTEFRALLQSTARQTRLMFVEPGAGERCCRCDEPRRAAARRRDGAGRAGRWLGSAGACGTRAAAGVTLLSFGGRVLRADAAGAAVISVLRYIWRDL